MRATRTSSTTLPDARRHGLYAPPSTRLRWMRRATTPQQSTGIHETHRSSVQSARLTVRFRVWTAIARRFRISTAALYTCQRLGFLQGPTAHDRLPPSRLRRAADRGRARDDLRRAGERAAGRADLVERAAAAAAAAA